MTAATPLPSAGGQPTPVQTPQITPPTTGPTTPQGPVTSTATTASDPAKVMENIRTLAARRASEGGELKTKAAFKEVGEAFLGTVAEVFSDKATTIILFATGPGFILLGLFAAIALLGLAVGGVAMGGEAAFKGIRGLFRIPSEVKLQKQVLEGLKSSDPEVRNEILKVIQPELKKIDDLTQTSGFDVKAKKIEEKITETQNNIRQTEVSRQQNEKKKDRPKELEEEIRTNTESLAKLREELEALTKAATPEVIKQKNEQIQNLQKEIKELGEAKAKLTADQGQEDASAKIEVEIKTKTEELTKLENELNAPKIKQEHINLTLDRIRQRQHEKETLDKDTTRVAIIDAETKRLDDLKNIYIKELDERNKEKNELTHKKDENTKTRLTELGLITQKEDLKAAEDLLNNKGKIIEKRELKILLKTFAEASYNKERLQVAQMIVSQAAHAGAGQPATQQAGQLPPGAIPPGPPPTLPPGVTIPLTTPHGPHVGGPPVPPP